MYLKCTVSFESYMMVLMRVKTPETTINRVRAIEQTFSSILSIKMAHGKTTDEGRGTYEWHTSTYEWHTDDIDIWVHTSHIRMT